MTDFIFSKFRFSQTLKLVLPLLAANLFITISVMAQTSPKKVRVILPNTPGTSSEVYNFQSPTAEKSTPAAMRAPVDPLANAPTKAEVFPSNADLGKSFPGLTSTEVSQLRKQAVAQGVPSLVFARALKNYQSLRGQDKTSRACFMGADLTTPEKGQMWMFCAKPKLKVDKMTVNFGSGLGSQCVQHLFRNQECAAYFGNKKDYCLPAGGNYVTDVVTQDKRAERAFVELTGLDKDQNDNTKERKVGMQQAVFRNGIPTEGRSNWFEQSQGSFTLPPTENKLAMADMSKQAPGKGMALYVYPNRDDIVQFRKTGKAPYWNADCAQKIGKPGWIGSKDYDAPSISEMEEMSVNGMIKAQEPSSENGTDNIKAPHNGAR